MVLLATLAASLPEPGSPNLVPFMAVLGAFVGAGVSRIRGEDRGQMRHRVEDFAFTTTALAFVIYLTGLVTGLY